jgi:cytochrome c oxidase cbb3-type subunit I
MVPRLWGRTQLYSLRMVNWHFWLATLGIVIYAAVMWVSGITQGLMWREYDAQGFLVYSFAETVAALHPTTSPAPSAAALPRGRLVMAYNIWMTIAGKVRDERPMLVAPAKSSRPNRSSRQWHFSKSTAQSKRNASPAAGR